MSMEYIRRTYNVPAKRGGRVCYTHEGVFYGTILSARGGLIRVRWDNDGRVSSMHPTWALEYCSERTSHES